MCGRYTLLTPAQELEIRAIVKEAEERVKQRNTENVKAHTLYSYVQGTENEPVYAGGIEPPDKTVSTGSTTPRDLTTWEEYWVQTCVMAERVGQRLRALRKLAKTIEVGVTFIDTDR